MAKMAVRRPGASTTDGFGMQAQTGATSDIPGGVGRSDVSSTATFGDKMLGAFAAFPEFLGSLAGSAARWYMPLPACMHACCMEPNRRGGACTRFAHARDRPCAGCRAWLAFRAFSHSPVCLVAGVLQAALTTSPLM